jgi:hypothetical protein
LLSFSVLKKAATVQLNPHLSWELSRNITISALTLRDFQLTIVQTHSEVREHPSSGSVTAAARGADMEADVQRKIKLWGVLEAFRDG